MSPRRLLLAAVALALALVFALALVAPAKPPASPEPLSIALPQVPHAALLHLAAERGYLAEAGIDARLEPVSHGRVALARLAEGKADLAAAADVAFAIEVARGAPFALAAQILAVSNENRIVARRDRGVVGAADLAGRRVGVTFGTSAEYFLYAFLVRNRIAPEALALVDLAPGAIGGALVRGEVDAIVTWPPLNAEPEAALGARATVLAEPTAYIGSFILAGRRETLAERRPALERLLGALARAEAFAAAQPEAAIRIVAARIGVEPHVVAAAWPDFRLRLELSQALLGALEDQARWALSRGHAPAREAPVNFLRHIEPAALERVRAERVTLVR